MYFSRIELHDFGVYRGTHEMRLVDGTDGKNITLVGGLNGRGKTTLHDGILICLYGRQAMKYIQEKARSYDKLLIDHINKNAQDGETYVAVTLCLDDGTVLRVKRSWTAQGKKADQDISVEKNGAVDKYLGENWSYYVEEILPFGIARFFFFNNEKITQLADDVSFEQIKSSIKSAIGVSSIEKAIDHADEVIRRKEKSLAAFEKSEENLALKEAEAQIRDVEARLEENMRQINDLERRCTSLDAQLEAQEKEFWASGGDLGRNRDAIKQELQNIKDDHSRTEGDITQAVIDASTPLYMCRGLVVQAYEREKSLQDKQTRLNTDRMIDEVRSRLLERLEASSLDAAALDMVRGIVNEVLKKRLSDDGDGIYTSISATGMMLYQHLVTEVFQSVTQRISDLLMRIESQENELMSLDAHLGEADEKTLAMQLFDALKLIEQEKAVADDELRRQKEAEESLRKQKETLHQRRIRLYKEIAEKENANDDDARIVRYAAMSVEVLSEFKKRLQREKVAKLSDTVTRCFKELIEKESLVGAVKIDPETLNVSILDTNGHVLLKEQLSAGEQQMFAVAIVWALALTSGYKAPVVIDTPMARLDSSHRANFVTKYLPAASSQVVVLSTDEEVSGRYLDLVRDNVVDCYTLLYREQEQCTSIIHGYFGEGHADDP